MRGSALCLAFFSLAILSLIGCNRRSADATVLAKEHIAAAEVRASPDPAESASPNEHQTPIVTETARPLAADEIEVDQYVALTI